MCQHKVTDMNETLNMVTGYNSDGVIDLGYEKNFHNGLYRRNLPFQWLLMKMLLTTFLKIPHNVIKAMVVLMVLLLSLKLVRGGVHHTFGGGHDIVCTPPFLLGGGVEPPTKYFKGGDMTRSRGFAENERVTFFRRGCSFYVKNKLKSEIFSHKNIFLCRN